MTKVQVKLNGQITGEGFLLPNEAAQFRVAPGNKVVKITKTLHPIARKGIWQFAAENVEIL